LTIRKGRIHFNEERLRELAAQNTKALGDHKPGRGAPGFGGRTRNWRALKRAVLSASSTALEQHRQALQAKQGGRADGRSRFATVAGSPATSTGAMPFAQAQELTRARNEINALDLQKQGKTSSAWKKLSAEKNPA